MHSSIEITSVVLTPEDDPVNVFDMTGRCAFAICTEGDFRIKILNEQYTVSDRCMFACMPFVNIEVVSVQKRSEVIFGYILIEDLPKMINRWVNINNLIAIQNNPLVKISESQFCRLTDRIKEYQKEYGDSEGGAYENICNQIQNDIIEYQSLLIVAQVLKMYFTNMSMVPSGHTQRDVVFQRFMLALYGNFREHREVHFYALRSGVSLKYFSTIVRQFSGSSPSEWIEAVVVGEAKTLLCDVNNHIKEIATALNFPDAPTFTKYFLRVTGMTPKGYRQSLIKKTSSK